MENIKFDYVIPQSKREITLKQWMAFQKVAEDENNDEEFIELKMIEIFCGIPFKYIIHMKASEVADIHKTLANLFLFKSKKVNTFSFDSVDWGLINDFDKDITESELIDLDKYFEMKDYARWLSILYRPITKKVGDLYSIESYTATHTDFLDAPFEIFEGVNDFFLTFLKNSPKDILKSIQRNQKMMKKMDSTFQQKLNLLLNGVDIPNLYG